MSILIAAVLPLASAEAQRDKEAELIFRGLQYAEGIRNFRRRYGRYPNTLKEMFEIRPRTLRKLWKDPMTNSDKWGLITLTTGAPLPGTGGAAARRAAGAGADARSDADARRPRRASARRPQTGRPARSWASTRRRRRRDTACSTGRENYNEWRFTEQTLLEPGPDAAAGPGRHRAPGIVPLTGGDPRRARTAGSRSARRERVPFRAPVDAGRKEEPLARARLVAGNAGRRSTTGMPRARAGLLHAARSRPRRARPPASP